MEKMGLPEPEFQSLRGDFKVILRKFAQNEQKNVKEFTEKFTEEFTENEQKILKENQIIERIGSDRKGYWKILN